MAKIEAWLSCDLKKPVQVQGLSGNVFSMDNNGSRINVRIYDNGEKTTVSGSVTANCILADGSTINVNGSLTTDNGQSVAYVDIPQSCLLVPGPIRIAIKLTASGVIATLAAVVTTVYRTQTDIVITPSAQIITDWNAEISAAIATQNAAIANQDTKINDLKSALTQLDETVINRNNILQKCVISENEYYNTSAHADNNYSYFTIPVNSGDKLVLYTEARFVSKTGAIILENATAGYEYTADFTGNLVVTFNNSDRSNWRVYRYGVSANDVPPYDEIEINGEKELDEKIEAVDDKADAIDGRVDILEELINHDNLMQGAVWAENEFYSTSAHANNNYSYFIIPVVSGKSYVISTTARFISKQGEVLVENAPDLYTYTANFTGNLIVTVGNGDRERWKIYESTVDGTDVPAFDHVEIAEVDKLYNKNNLLQSYTCHEGKFYNAREYTNANYSYFSVTVVSGKSYLIRTECRFLSKASTLIDENLPNNYVYTADFSGALYLSFNNANKTNWKFYELPEKENNVPLYVEKVLATDSYKDILYNKVWYACGDSFTHGDFTSYTEQYTFNDNPYYGELMVYPFFIGRRTGAYIKNLAQNGMTLADADPNNPSASFISKYQEIGADAEYITLKFGINDDHQSVVIGDIDSNDDSTFCGAYNKVISWIMANRPYAKIGIIVTNGLEHNEYALASIAIAKKYGISYLNEWSGEDLPVFFRSGRTDVAESVKTAKNNLYRVSETNWHPNPKCHENESTIVEAWLKSL